MIDQWQREIPDVVVGPVSVIARILRAAQYFDHEINRGLSGHGLSNRELDVLSALRRGGPPYALTASELRREILFSSGGLTKLLDRLERAGLITREQDSNDRRSVRIVLSDAGYELQQKAIPFEIELETRLLAPLDEDQRQTLAQVLQVLLASHELAHPRWPLRPRDSSPPSASPAVVPANDRRR
jgi:DNA-binding MarR family transcriptional regulator